MQIAHTPVCSRAIPDPISIRTLFTTQVVKEEIR